MREPPSGLAGEGRNGAPRVTARVSHGQGHRRELAAGPRVASVWVVGRLIHTRKGAPVDGAAGGESLRMRGASRGEHGRSGCTSGGVSEPSRVSHTESL